MSAGSERRHPVVVTVVPAEQAADRKLERLAYSVDEAAYVLSISRETVYELIRTGQLRSRKAGHRRIIAKHHVLEFLDGR